MSACFYPALPSSFVTSSVAGTASAERFDLSMTLFVYQDSKDMMYCCKIEKETTMMVFEINMQMEGGRKGQRTVQ